MLRVGHYDIFNPRHFFWTICMDKCIFAPRFLYIHLSAFGLWIARFLLYVFCSSNLLFVLLPYGDL